MTLPKPLVDSIREGRMFLFLGSGASLGASHSKNWEPFSGQDLSNRIAEKFLGKEFKNQPLQYVSELAISETDLFKFQEFVAELFEGFYPADFHKIIPKFYWSGISTTNYDLIIERAYDSFEKPVQDLVVFVKDNERVEEKSRNTNSVMYLKLHGCITNINDEKTPLILTPDQYISHRRGRKRLFEKLQNFAYEYPFLFVGYSLSDNDIRAILNEISDLGDARPRSYVLTPKMTPAEIRFWENKKISHIDMDFKSFLMELDSIIPSHFRILLTIENEKKAPIYKKFSNQREIGISESLHTFLTRDVEHINDEIKTKSTDPKAFYKGYFTDWNPIESDFDVKRSFSDSIMTEVFLADEYERREKCEFILIKGYAGSGKSVLMRRLAWDAAIQYDKLCLFVKSPSFIDYEALTELFRLCNERIFLFIDNVSEFADLIDEIIPKAKKEKLPLTLIGAERFNEWNNDCGHLDGYVNHTYCIPYLNEKEIEGLIELLRIHKSLGYLTDKPKSEQKEALSKHAGRQLLVALHEATLGKPLSDIVLDEYNSINSIRAKSLYLSVCVFHRVRVPMRAGLISRIHGIPFSEFSNELFKPLEFIVYAKRNDIIHDYEYQTRHSHIAEIVFERVLTDVHDRFDEYLRIINSIDIDYSSDREAFKGLMNARELLSLFPDPQMIRQLFIAAHKRSEDDPMLIHHEALFEMNSSNGNIEKAANLLQKALELAPYSKTIAHSLSELALKRAEMSQNEIEKEKYLQESKKIAETLISKGSATSHPYHTLLKIDIYELERMLPQDDVASLQRRIKGLEKSISNIVQLFPDDGYIREIEAKFNSLINENDKALISLEKGFVNNKGSAYIASRLAKVYESNGMIENALTTLRECLELNPSDKHINYQLALLLQENSKTINDEAGFFLRRSFTEGDNHYAAQFWYARYLYIKGEFEEALRLFSRLENVNIDTRIKQEPRGELIENGKPTRFSGQILKIESSYAFIIRDRVQDRIFSHVSYNDSNEWKGLHYMKRINFNLFFNFRGPLATNISSE